MTIDGSFVSKHSKVLLSTSLPKSLRNRTVKYALHAVQPADASGSGNVVLRSAHPTISLSFKNPIQKMLLHFKIITLIFGYLLLSFHLYIYPFIYSFIIHLLFKICNSPDLEGQVVEDEIIRSLATIVRLPLVVYVDHLQHGR